MAAGMGSRFGGGIKQLQPVGPSGELIIDYSIHDAIRAGFGKVIFVIRRDIEEDFRSAIGDRIQARCRKLGVETAYCFQSLTDLPGGRMPPEGRTKPWGTCHAVLAARELLREPFAVINADDYYGREAYQKMCGALNALDPSDPGTLCMAGFTLGNTLSENGTVTRGLCRVDTDGWLTGIRETRRIAKTPDGAEADGEALDAGTPVSMNMWGLTLPFVREMEAGFERFLDGGALADPKSEFLLPEYIGGLLAEGKIRVRVLPVGERWYGVTYKEDAPAVAAAIRGLVDGNVYHKDLYADVAGEKAR